MKVKPDLSFWKLWNISFGFFGVQIAYALQSANISRIFATLGADPHSLSYFLDTPSAGGNHCTTDHRSCQRQDMDPFRTTHPLPFCRFAAGGMGDVPTA